MSVAERSSGWKSSASSVSVVFDEYLRVVIIREQVTLHSMSRVAVIVNIILNAICWALVYVFFPLTKDGIAFCGFVISSFFVPLSRISQIGLLCVDEFLWVFGELAVQEIVHVIFPSGPSKLGFCALDIILLSSLLLSMKQLCLIDQRLLLVIKISIANS